MTEKKSTKRNQTLGYFGAFITLGIGTSSLGPALPFLAHNTGSAISEISILFTAKAGGYMLGSFISGWLYDRLPGHAIAITSIVGIAGTMALLPVTPLLLVLVLIVALLGMVEGSLDVGCNAMLVWVHGEKVGPFMNALHFFFGIGTFFAPIMIAQSVLHSGEINWGFYTLALIMMPVVIWLIRTPSLTHPKTSAESVKRGNTKILVLIMAFLIMYVGAEVGFGGWVYTYALEGNLATVASGAYLTSAYWGAFTVGRLASIPIAARVRPRWILFVDLVGSVFSLLIIVLFPDSAAALWVGAILLGLFFASIFPTIFIFAERRMTLTGAVTSMFFVGASLGGMSFPWLMGQLFETISPKAIMLVIMGDVLLAGVFYFILMRVSAAVKPVEIRPT